MPSDKNHIDDFFRRKEEETAADTRYLDSHWQRMQELMQVSYTPASSPRRIPVWMKAAAVLLLTGMTAVVVLQNKKNTRVARNNNPPAKADTYPSAKSIATAVNDSFIRTAPLKTNETGMTANKKVQRYSENTARPAITGTDNTNKKASMPVIDPYDTDIRLTKHFVKTNQQAYEEFYASLKKKAQVFTIYGSRDTILECREGSTLHFPAGCLQTATGAAVTGLVRVYVQEFYSLGDIIGNKLNTVSDGVLLISGGMLNIRAMLGEEELLVKPGKTIGLQMPTQRLDPRMQLFTGQEQPDTKIIPGSKKDHVIHLRFTTEGDSLLVPEASGQNKNDAGSYLNGTSINWSPAGQQQLFPLKETDDIRVLNLMDNPFAVRYGKKTVARFIVPVDATVSVDFVKEELVKRYGNRYDVIKVRREWNPFTWDRKNFNSGGDWYSSACVGDSVSMKLPMARRYNLISVEDSLRIEKERIQKRESLLRQNNLRETQRDLIRLTGDYDFKLSGLGWINCDRFYNTPGPKTELVLQTDTGFEQTFFQSILIFDRMNSVMPGNWKNGRVYFSGLPVNEPVTAICIGAKEGKIYLAMQHTSVSRLKNEKLHFEETSPEVFKEKMKAFGNVKNR